MLLVVSAVFPPVIFAAKEMKLMVVGKDKVEESSVCIEKCSGESYSQTMFESKVPTE